MSSKDMTSELDDALQALRHWKKDMTSELDDALQALRHWKQEGKVIPNYCFGNGCPYIAYLLGLYNGPLDNNSSSLDTDPYYVILEHNPDIFKLIAGPHGWAILQMLIARKGLKDD